MKLFLALALLVCGAFLASSAEDTPTVNTEYKLVDMSEYKGGRCSDNLRWLDDCNWCHCAKGYYPGCTLKGCPPKS